MPSCPSERCLGAVVVVVDVVDPRRSAGRPSSVVAFWWDDAASAAVLAAASSSPVGFVVVVAIVVSGKLRLRLAATVSGLQWRKSDPLPQSPVDDEEAGETRGEAIGGESPSDNPGLVGLEPLSEKVRERGARKICMNQESFSRLGTFFYVLSFL